MAVTRDGIPVRCWTFPGDTTDTAIIRTVKDDPGGWGLRRLVWVADRGFASAANRAYLTRGGGHYIHAEKLRHTNTEASAAPTRPLPQRGRQPARQRGPRQPRRRPERRRRGRGPHPAGSWSATTPRRPNGTDRSEPTWSPTSPSSSTAPTPGRRGAAMSWSARSRPSLAASLPAPHPGRAAAHRPRRHQAGAAPGRQVAAAHLRPHPHPRRSRRRIQAADRAAPGVPPPRRPHPRARATVLAGAAAHPRGRERHRRHLAQHPTRTRPPAPGHPGHPAGRSRNAPP
jgi:hypothetical protein